jgi:hypothetical protein
MNTACRRTDHLWLDPVPIYPKPEVPVADIAGQHLALLHRDTQQNEFLATRRAGYKEVGLRCIHETTAISQGRGSFYTRVI